MIHKIFIAGSGGIGEAAAILLREWSKTDVDVYLGDISRENLEKAKNFVIENSARKSNVETVLMTPEGASDEMRAAFEQCEILLDCSPGSQAPRMAQFAKDFKMHYANLTEYVAETDAVIEIAKNADTGFVVQTGLAPGFINVLAMSLYNKFVEKFQNENVERIGMKVGALSTCAHAPHFYGFTWSPIGVATEYVKTARVVRDHKQVELPALSERERIIINGYVYEADLTSGGAANLPEFLSGRTKDLDYKTLRHVGHYKWVEGLITKLNFDENLPQNLEDVMLEKVPSVDDDFVIVHSSVEGFDAKGRRRLIEKAFHIKPLEINGKHLRAIQTTTAAPLVECADMLATNKFKGVILQSDIDPETFLTGNFVSRVYKN
ncbi:MAG: saccharopine dehydrogenase NADP-binding domain-containing protein [Pyrinomonadaceae bacterium]|nr:saccharopine dehydrogenase NADP-binding domain-containing protein [Pyrinomonadaceae bacterium]